MAAIVVVDTGYLVALLNRADLHHQWAVAHAQKYSSSWKTCEAVLSESFHLLGPGGAPGLAELLRRGRLVLDFALDENLAPVLTMMKKYADVPMSLADACLVRMTETLGDPLVLTTDSDFLIYRRHSRQIVPAVLP